MIYCVENHHLLKNGNPVSYKKSPNFGGKIIPEIIIIHYDGTNGTGGLQWLTEKGSNVSAHLWIAKTGTIWQLLPFNTRAWHAGKSEWDGRSDCNSWSIGIENQGCGDGPWPQMQLDANKGVIEALFRAYTSITDVVGHEDVCIPEGRKVDPGKYYDWKYVLSGLKDVE